MEWKRAGSVLGEVTLYFAPNVLKELSRSMETVVVSGTNGKTTTSNLTATVLGSLGQVAVNNTGANLPNGIVTALIERSSARFGVVEVDERYFPSVCADTRPAVVILLNLSRDQLDRNPEPRMLAAAWRAALADLGAVTAVANCDDPLICWVAEAAHRVVWVAGGGRWTRDSHVCPGCDGMLRWSEARAWMCPACGRAKPAPDWTVDEGELTWRAEGRSFRPRIALPGRINQVNAAMALAAGSALGAPPDVAIGTLEGIGSVSGRYETIRIGPRELRLLLAKNPASWTETIEVLGGASSVVVILNARRIDGHDPSWIWDVDFSGIAETAVYLAGDRRLDLAVRLHTADIEFTVVDSLHEACDLAPPGRIDVLANYTAFLDLIRAVRAGKEESC
jgi:lipid II isoglutaminyl synthase (glutamine-hydrolysing)